MTDPNTTTPATLRADALELLREIAARKRYDPNAKVPWANNSGSITINLKSELLARVDALLDAAPAAPVAEYDGNHVQNHCTECNEHEVECSCAQAVAADGAEQDELQGIVEACEELGCPDGMTPRQFISDIWSLLIAWYQASSEGKIAVSDPAYHLVTATAALMGDERAAVSPATAEPTDYAAIEREHFGDPDKRTGIYAQATADERAAIVEQCAKIADSFTCGSCGMDGKVGAAIRASQAAAPQANAAEESEDAYVIRRLSETLADVCVTLRGEDPVHPDDPLNKIELVKRLAEVLRMEVELYRAQAAAPAAAGKTCMCSGLGPCERRTDGSCRVSAPANLASAISRHVVIDWAVERWTLEVSGRPLGNIQRRSLDDAWRQFIRYLGADDVSLLGPRHDDLIAAHSLSIPMPDSEGGEA
ncbi:hypothetical protein [Burkholderia glumae]|uniref:hypothetical protein n=1 Tax=Burkholderia glumae TaxID=337 RepID=UPI001297C015|nr:hypothetical protein [Burkholderia glumae]QGA37983.1 hypothetical protein GAS19_10330 [Burkholderia glumae]